MNGRIISEQLQSYIMQYIQINVFSFHDLKLIRAHIYPETKIDP